MTYRSSPKLFRMVCKRASMMRAPFGDGIPWTSEKPPTISKPLLKNYINSKSQSTKKKTSQSQENVSSKSKEGK